MIAMKTIPAKKIITNVLFVLALVLMLAIIGEVFCRLAMPLEKKRDRYMATRNLFQLNNRYVMFDDELGYTIRPNLKAPLNNEEFHTMILTNSAGFRDSEESLKNPSILMLGDSFAFGWGVNREARCDKYLEDMTGKRVLDMGAPAYGTLQEFLALKRFSEKNDISGKTVVILLYPNDIVDNLSFGSGSIRIKNGDLAYSKFDKAAFDNLTDMYRTRPYRGISQSSYLLYVLKNAKKELKNKLRGKKNIETRETNAGDGRLKYEIFGIILGKIKDFCAEKKLKVIFVWTPSVRRYEETSAKFGGDEEDVVFQGIKKSLDDLKLPLIDLTGSLTHNDYYELDGHLKPSGHYKIAVGIKDYLSNH